MSTMKAAQFTKKGGPLEVSQVPIPKPGLDQVRIKVMACAICHGDVIAQYGGMPGCVFPRIPGHEVSGLIDEIGEGVKNWKKGEHVGVGWFGGHCGSCNSCYNNQWVACENGISTGITINGGFAEYMVASTDALVRVPETLSHEESAPLMCAGITTFNALKENPAKPGSLVVVIGVGGLGHLAIQYANKLGYQVVAVSSGKEKEQLAKKLGAHYYFDSSNATETVNQIKALGGASIILATAPNAKSVEDMIPALTVGGKMLVVAAIMEPLKINPVHMLAKRQSVICWSSGDSRDIFATLKFSKQHGVKPMIEVFPLDKANEAYQFALSNKARFRVVLKIN